MANSEKTRNFVVVVEDLEKTITADTHIASFLDVDTLDEIEERHNPILQIVYEELDLNRIDAAYRAKQDLLPLRNFLVGKKKGLHKTKCVFGLYCLTAKNNEDAAAYYLQVETSLYDLVDEDRKDVSEIFAKIKICGVSQEPVLLESGIGYKDRSFEFNREGTNSMFFVTKENLQNPRGKEITFSFTISIECTPRWDYEGFSIESEKSTSILNEMYDLPESSKDITIVVVNGAEVKAHKVILMVHCPVFCSMLNSDNKTAEAQSGRILMGENSEEGVTQLIRYLYGLSLEVDALTPNVALELFKLSNKYGLKDLETDMQYLLTGKGLGWYSVDSLLELYYFAVKNEVFEELRAHALTELADGLSTKDLTESDFFKNLDNEEQQNLVITFWNWSRIRI